MSALTKNKQSIVAFSLAVAYTLKDKGIDVPLGLTESKNNDYKGSPILDEARKVANNLYMTFFNDAADGTYVPGKEVE